jgi:hypothetical protein
MEKPGKIIKVKKIPRKEPRLRGQADQALDIYSEICYYYPAYTIRQARRLPYKHVKTLLRKARQLEALRYHNLTQIAAASRYEKYDGLNDLLTHYQEQMNG